MIEVAVGLQTMIVAMIDLIGLQTGWALQGVTEAFTGTAMHACRSVFALQRACLFEEHGLPHVTNALASRREPYPRDQQPPRDFRGRDPSFRDQPMRDGPIRDLPPRDARDTLPPAPAPAAPLIAPVPTQPASQIVVPPPEPQIDREKVCSVACSLPCDSETLSLPILPCLRHIMPVCRSVRCCSESSQR